MPEDMIVRESRGLHLLMALLCTALLVVLLPSSFKTLSDGQFSGGDIVLPAFTALLVCGVPLGLRVAWRRDVVLVAFKRGLFCPQLHPEVIPWSCVESVTLSYIGKGTGIRLVFTAEFETKLRMNRLIRFFFMIDSLIGLKGRYVNGLHDRSDKAVVHAIDDWIRYETRQAPKPRYRPGPVDAVLLFLGGRNWIG
ncbi:hypothetical protein [Rhizobium sp. NFR07]|uniref:hypothetical protein n=1 Tax=Rhizobium sp. NFR07 TaxID=1566262 RepID=UPI0015A721BA|nr:hypothetical protein [Rhizobium sp. NFR07]